MDAERSLAAAVINAACDQYKLESRWLHDHPKPWVGKYQQVRGPECERMLAEDRAFLSGSEMFHFYASILNLHVDTAGLLKKLDAELEAKYAERERILADSARCEEPHRCAAAAETGCTG